MRNRRDIYKLASLLVVGLVAVGLTGCPASKSGNAGNITLSLEQTAVSAGQAGDVTGFTVTVDQVQLRRSDGSVDVAVHGPIVVDVLTENPMGTVLNATCG